MLLIPLVAALLPAQEPAAPDATSAPAGEPVNRVEMIVNTDLITRRDLIRQLARARERNAVTTREDELRLRLQIFRAAMEELLLRQAGEDLGQPKEAVDRVLDNVWQNQIERSGGIREFSLEVEGEEQTSLEKREKLEGDLYMWTYQRVVTGNEPAKDGRVIADRYIRPGTRRRLYDYMGRTGDGLVQIGGKPRRIVMQQLLLELDGKGELEEQRERALALRRLARDLRQQALDGADFNALVNEHGALKGTASLSGEIRVDSLRRRLPELADFAVEASLGEVSPVVPIPGPDGTLGGWLIVRILETKPGEEPPFGDLEVQRQLEKLAQGQLDDRRREDAVQELLQSAYVWSPDLDRDRARRAALEAEELLRQP